MSPENTLRDLLELKEKCGFSGIPITGQGPSFVPCVRVQVVTLWLEIKLYSLSYPSEQVLL